MRIVGTFAVACLLATQGGVAAAEPAASPGSITVVLALPDATVAVSVDDREVAAGAVVGDILGPFKLDPGSHEIAFTGESGSLDVTSRMDVTAGMSQDVVLHMPAEEDGKPIVSSFDTSMAPIGAGKARVLLAHTATVAPADVRVDGQVVFTNIANGEYAEADVPAGGHSVALLPTGQSSPPILGPLDVTLKQATMTMVYAVGSPTTRSMDVVAHTVDLPSDGSAAPDTIDTGSVGLAQRPVTSFGSFGSAPVTSTERAVPVAPFGSTWTMPALLFLLGVSGGLGVVLHRRRAPQGPRARRLGRSPAAP